MEPFLHSTPVERGVRGESKAGGSDNGDLTFGVSEFLLGNVLGKSEAGHAPDSHTMPGQNKGSVLWC